jgi:hypothetical protein
MKKLILIFSLILMFSTANAQWNPLVQEPLIEETPINLAIDSFTNISFLIGNSGNQAMTNYTQYPLKFTVSFSKVKPGNIITPAASVSGPGMAWFKVQYSTSLNTYLFTQIAPIPNAENGGLAKIIINVKVTIPSPSTNKTNGFQVNLQPPAYTNGPNNIVDDAAGIFTYTSFTSSLPVELVRFDGTVNQCKADLMWETASEMNNDYFSVQKSSNAIDWNEIAQVKGNGNSTTPQTYNYTDVQSNTGIIYYRLVQYDFDGRNDLSNVISVNGQGCDGFEFKLYPNPTYEFVNIELNQFKEKYQYTIYSSKGDMVRTSNLLNATQRIYVGDLASGAYLMNLVSDTKQISQPFIIQK